MVFVLTRKHITARFSVEYGARFRFLLADS